MNDFDSAPRPLRFSPIMWVALAIVALIGLHRIIGSPETARTLSYLEGDHPRIIRYVDQAHLLPLLGLEIQPPEGWVYLSRAEDSLASTPTFSHSKSRTIVRLEPFRFRNWPPANLEPEVEDYEGFGVEWVELDHRRVGRLRGPQVDVAIIVITHQPHARLTPEVRELLDRIRPIR